MDVTQTRIREAWLSIWKILDLQRGYTRTGNCEIDSPQTDQVIVFLGVHMSFKYFLTKLVSIGGDDTPCQTTV